MVGSEKTSTGRDLITHTGKEMREIQEVPEQKQKHSRHKVRRRMGPALERFRRTLESTGSYLETEKVETGAAQDPAWNLHDRRMFRHTLNWCAACTTRPQCRCKERQVDGEEAHTYTHSLTQSQ